MEWLVIIAVVLAAVILIGMERERISLVLNELLMFLLRPFEILMTAVGGAVAALSNWNRREIQEEGEEPALAPAAAAPDAAGAQEAQEALASQPVADARPAPIRRPPYHLNRILCGLIFTALAAAMCAPDTYLVRMSLALMGLAGDANDAPPVALDWMAAFSLIACGIFWGIVLFDLHRGTNLLPEQFTTGSMRPVLKWTAYVCFGLGLTAVIVLGIWRGVKVAGADVPQAEMAASADAGSLQISGASAGTAGGAASSDEAVMPEQGADPFDVFAAAYFNTVLSGVVFISLAVAVCGIIFLLRYLSVLLVAVLLLLPLALLFLALRMNHQLLITAIYLKDRVLEFIERIGQSLIRNVWPPLEALRDALHRRVRNAAENWGRANEPAQDSRTSGSADDDHRAPADGGRHAGAADGPSHSTGNPFGAMPIGEPVFAGANGAHHSNGAGRRTNGNGAPAGAGPTEARGGAGADTGEAQSQNLEDWNWG